MKVHWLEVQKLARAHQIENPTENLETFSRFLKIWWCRKYNRPFKDPLLTSYTMNELIYEFLRHFYFQPENDPKKELQAKKIREDEDKWIREQLTKIHQQTAPPPTPKPDPNPPIDPPPDISTKF